MIYRATATSVVVQTVAPAASPAVRPPAMIRSWYTEIAENGETGVVTTDLDGKRAR